jgi:SSS family solute:Na+ symporter
MGIGPIIFAIAYFAVLIILANVYTHKKVKTIKDYTQGGNTVTWGLVALTLSLIPHGAGHTLGLWEASAAFGVAQYWWAIIAGGAFIPLLMLWFGPWVRETGSETIAEVMEKLYGKKMRIAQAAINVGTWTGITMSETIAIGVTIFALSGGSVPLFPWCIIIAFLLIVCYIIFGGVLELVWVSTINAIVMTIGSYMSLFFIGLWLTANAAGWDGIVDYYNKIDQGFKFSLLSFSPDLLFQTILPVTILHIAACSVAQGMYSPLLAAKSDQDCRKGFILCTLSNVITAFPWVIIAMVAMAFPAFNQGADAAKTCVFGLASTSLPSWLFALLAVSLLASVLSAASGQVFGNSTVLVNDLLKRACFPNMKDETRLKLMRPAIVVVALLAAIPALFAPIIFPVFLWCFSFGIPVFIIFIYGLVWKTSRSAAWVTLVAALIVDFWWTFWTPAWAPGYWGLNVYPVTLVSVVLGTIMYAVLPGEKGYLRRMREAKKAAA